MNFEGELFRFINPRYSRPAEVFSGRGALHVSGRWHLAGMGRVTYTALEPETAMAESLAAARYYGLPLSSATPLVLVSGHAKLNRVLDLRDGAVRRTLHLSLNTMTGTDWRAENAAGEAVTQALGRAMLESGFEALLAPSAAQSNGTNLIVFPDNPAAGGFLKIIRAVEWPI